MPEDRMAETEKNRQASQAQAEKNRATADADNAEQRAEDQRANAEMDPNSPEGRQAAIRRGDPVQLQGEEGEHGMIRGTSTTTNESGAGFPASDEHRFVTGAAGVPIPESAGVPPQRPGDFDAAEGDRDMSPVEDVPAHVQDEGVEHRPEDAQVAEDTPESRAADEQREQDEQARQDEQDNASKGAKPRKGGKDAGDHGPGTSQ
jgi:hypothetical protein